MLPYSEPLGFISDIHGNLPALMAVLSEMDRRGVKHLFVAGDLLLGGQEPLEVWRLLQTRQAQSVRGTSDLALATLDPTRLTAIDPIEEERLAQFRQTRKAIGELILASLKRLPETIRLPLVDGREIVVVHGSPADLTQGISHDMDDEDMMGLIADDPADIFICGETHVPFYRRIGEIDIVNVGTVGQAPEGDVAHLTVITPGIENTRIEQTWVNYHPQP